MFNVSSNPHVKDRITTQKVMLYVIIALLPTTLFGVFNYTSMFGLQYGIRSILLIVTCVTVCVLSEYLFNKATKRPNTVGDLSAIVTGMILALNLPVTFPLWMAMVGSAFAIVVAFQGQAAFVCQRAVQFDFFTNGGFIFTKCSRDCSFGRTIFNAGKDDTSFFQC